MKFKTSLALLAAASFYSHAEASNTFQLENVFDLEYANQIEMTKNGDTIYFVRNRMDIKSDRKVSNIWSVNPDGKTMLPLTSGVHMDYSPVLSPDETRLAFISTRDGSSQIYVKWLKTGNVAKISNLTQSPGGLTWTPDGKQLVFSQFVPAKSASPVSLPGKPEGAKWAEPAKYIDDTYYRADGGGYSEKGYRHFFIISATGGNARQLSAGDFDHGGAISFNEKGDAFYFSANRYEDNELHPTESEIYKLSLADHSITQITDRKGPDSRPKVSPNGRYLAYTGYDDKKTNYENNDIYFIPSRVFGQCQIF